LHPILADMQQLTPVPVPVSVPTGADFVIHGTCFTATCGQDTQRVWVGDNAALGPTILLRSSDGRYVIAPWLEGAAPRALGALIRSGALVPPDPHGVLVRPTVMDDAEDAALRVAVIEALLETGQLQLDDAIAPLRWWRLLRDGMTGPPRTVQSIR
jgi:hypothetical protein